MTGGGGRTPSDQDALVRLARTLYRFGTQLLPGAFRSDYGPEMEACFESILAETRHSGRLGLLWVTVRAIADLATRAPAEHLAIARARAHATNSGLGGTWQDVRQAVGSLRHRCGMTLGSVLTLALGIAATTSMFSVVHGVVLSPMPYPDSERIVQVDHSGLGLGIDRGLGITYGFYRFYEERATAAESMAMYQTLHWTLAGAGEPLGVRAVRTTPSLGRVLGIRPALGRWFTEADVQSGAAPVVVLSHRLWRERFGGDPGALGEKIELHGRPYEVVGIAAPNFSFPSDDSDLWFPQAVAPHGVGGWNRQAVARLAPGRTPQDLEMEMQGLLPRLRELTDDPVRVAGYLDDARIDPRIVTLKESVVGDVRPTLWILMGTAGFVLMVALMNLGSQFLGRAEETARKADDVMPGEAGSGRLSGAPLAESLIIAIAASGMGIVLAAVGIAVLKRSAPANVPRLDEVGLDPIAWAVAATAVLVLGLAPVLRESRENSARLTEGGPPLWHGRRRVRGYDILVAAQVAVAMILLIGSGLLFRAFHEVRSVDPGFSERQALIFHVDVGNASDRGREQTLRFHRLLNSELEALPGVERIGAVTQCLPLTPKMCWGETLVAEGLPIPDGDLPPITGTRMATAGYFEAIGIPVRGRSFRTADEFGDQPVAVISESTAEAYFGGENPLGRRISFGGDGPWYTIVGVAGDVRGRMETDEFLRVIYLPVSQEGELPPNSFSYVLATSVPPVSLVADVRRAVARRDPTALVNDVETLRDRIDGATAPAAFPLILIGLAATLTLLLGVGGVYGMVARAVRRRTPEVGVRTARGARGGEARWIILRKGGLVVGVGIAVGLVAAVGLSRLMRGMLYGISPTDPASYAALTTIMLTIAGAALYLPARRACRVDRVDALGPK